ncbi:prolyl oligopeptidase family serine peptidase [Kineosporia succinea]
METRGAPGTTPETGPWAAPETTVRRLHGRPVADPYGWLDDPHDPRTVAWLEQQDAWARTQLDRTGESGRFRHLLRQATHFDHYGAPSGPSGHLFALRRPADGDHEELVTIDATGERVLLDPRHQHPHASIASWSASRDGTRVSVNTVLTGEPDGTLHVIDAATGAHLDHSPARAVPTPAVWGPDSTWLVHVRRTGSGPVRVVRHRVGHDWHSDLDLLGHPLAASDQVELALSPGGDLLVVSVADGVSAENRLLLVPLGQDGTAPGHPWPADFGAGGWSAAWPLDGRRLIVLTDAQADRGQLLSVELEPAAEGWTSTCTVLVPEPDGEVLAGFAVLRDELLVLSSRDDEAVLTRHDRWGKPLAPVPLPGAGLVSEFTGAADPDPRQAWITYSDRATPETVLTYGDGHLRHWRGGTGLAVPPTETVRETFTASDGATVPLIITRPVGVADGARPPTILQAYGAFGVPQTPEYYAAAAVWAQSGGQFVTVGVRGGGEYGEEWHRAGRREHKGRSIDDFTEAAARFQHRPPGALGFSAGGLLVAAAAVRRPDLFGAIACAAAPLDMTRFEDSGFGDRWVDEFGSVSDPEQLSWLLTYSPYHRAVTDKLYPAALFLSLSQDERVDPLHARKMCAVLQNANDRTDPSRAVVLRRDLPGDHALRDRSHRLSLFAEMLGFLSSRIGPAAAGSAEGHVHS